MAVEFALVAARRTGWRTPPRPASSARAALRSSRELSLLLAGSQLGITLCTLGLGAVAKPAVHDLLAPLLEPVGLPAAAADLLAFVLALVVVTFLHLVVGEMAPEVVGDRAPGTLGDAAGAADARVPVAHPAAAGGAERAGQRAAAAGRGRAGRRGRRRPQPGRPARAGRPLGRRPARWTASGATSCSPRWNWTPRRCARWSGRPRRSAGWPRPTRVEASPGGHPARAVTCGTWSGAARTRSAWCTCGTRWPPAPGPPRPRCCGRC